MRQDILGALESALVRGESLKRAMLSLYNAGYTKQDIEESAAFLQANPSSKPVVQKNEQVQNVSNYESPKTKIKLILLIVAVIILLGALVGIFLFKEELINFFNSFFN